MSDSPVATPVSFAEFPAVTTAEWQARLTRDLKGQDPATLRWPLPDGFSVEPFYHREALAALGGLPAPLPHPQAPWLNVPVINVPAGDGRAEIDRAAAALEQGAEGIHFVLTEAESFAVHHLAEQMPLPTTYIGYTVAAEPDVLLAHLIDTAPGTALRGFLRFAPGAVPEGAELANYRTALRRCVSLTTGMPDFQALAVNGAFFGNRGATATQQIAFSLNTAAALLAELPNDEISPDQVAAALHLHVVITPSYFPEIAKLRALRRLWATLLHGFDLPAALNQRLRIHAATASWTQTTLDPHTNLLRHTTEAMSAVLGGADSLSVAPFDSLFAEPNDFSGRLARNLSVLLREESGLGRVQDPAAGSYYLETLTDQLAQEAWALFQRTEAAGGLPKVRAQVLDEIKQVATETFRRIASGQQIVVGTNRFQNRGEQFSFNPKKLLRSAEFDVTRASYPTEVLRLATALHFERREKKSKRAAVVLLGTNTNQVILETFLNMLLPHERPEIAASHPEGTLSLLYSSPEEATLMYATPEQFQRFARFIYQIPTEKQVFIPPTLLSSDMPTLQEAVRVFGFHEMKVQGYTTEQVLDRIQGR
ncbi:methylmalonyl-CoA mutase family protein [Hymenobacter arizonensis]|uniref:Heterodimeric methylmalonyl-CoA mutase small subunit n=1 Tax=Hymenobacter arizonensis TaxID=1227077 RepID=A0A1I6AYG5_HYMAR|nr:methylmalonyl-CoA mutase family protein [Hymenobacter arizonensis]SFQ73745.1 heterodimeric methylmalonyl-CoA mutase small subunit [Hymenobacter arizonensis]